MTRKMARAAFLSLLLTPISLFAQTYYVATTGNDSAAGTSAAPWRTLQKAANTVVAGDTVIVRAGEYVGFNLTRSGTSANRITFQGEPGAIVNARISAGLQHGINLEGASYVTIDGFRVDNSSNPSTSSAYITRYGIRTVLGTGVIIRNNQVIGAYSGILSGFDTNLLVEGNRVWNGREHGIYIGNSDSPNDNITVRGNETFGNATSGIQFNGDCESGGDGLITGGLIENNIFHDNNSKTMSMISMENVVIRNNLLYNNGLVNGAGGIHFASQPGCGIPSNNNVVVNNTIIEPRIAVVRLTEGSGNIIFNNIGVNPSSRFIIDESGSTNYIDSGSNLMRTSTTGLFQSAGSNDYHLVSNSPAVNIGRASYQSQNAPATDYDGTARPQGTTHDAGAFEFASGGGGNQPPTVVTAASATPNPVAGTTTNLSVLGDDDGGESNLVYTWMLSGIPPATVTFNNNGTNASKNVTATFVKAGTYHFYCSIRDAQNLNTISNTVDVIVNQTLTSIVVTPNPTSVQVSTTKQFTASARDQFNLGLLVQPAISWSAPANLGTVNSSGLLTAAATAGGPFMLTALSGSVSGTAQVTVTAGPPPNDPPIVDITSPLNGDSFTRPVTVTITVNASDPDGTVTRVDFYRGTTLLGTDASAPYAYSWVNPAAGAQQIRAVVIDNNDATDEETVSITVNAESGGTLPPSSNGPDGHRLVIRKGQPEMHFSCPGSGTAEIRSLKGASVSELNISGGLNWSAPGLASGMYFAEIQCDGTKVRKKLLIAR